MIIIIQTVHVGKQFLGIMMTSFIVVYIIRTCMYVIIIICIVKGETVHSFSHIKDTVTVVVGTVATVIVTE